MKKYIVAVVCVGLFAAVALGGCASQPKGPTDEEILARQTQEVVQAAMAKDIDKMLTYYSAKFDNPQFGDKAGLKNFLQGAKDAGYLDGVKIDLSKSKTVINGATATVSPVLITGSFGGATLDFTVTKENGAWLITAMDVQS